MKRVLIIAAFVLTVPFGVVAQETADPQDELATVNQNVNSAPINTNTTDRQANIAKLREPAALKPLLLIPLALALYLVYERLARRRSP